MHIGHLEQIFSIDKVVPVASFLADTITMLFIQVCFYGSHKFPCRSLLLSATVLNDTYLQHRTSTGVATIEPKEGMMD